ncbi:putative l-fucose permease glucose galactose transporter [Phaeomoniella chlamydospora]|uniref:Putative l-fucose permease glucose galactose transporter n=1 Tax=Phaeomoniella chlamydospora TaxID=158046 RepID=A0A0G2E7H6_PHACM|nr:putative l-fucose permease glucose galactose transporter [Phaeomoniella chlamydospora]
MKSLYKRKITADDNQVTAAVHLTLKQSLLPCGLVTILFFLWGFAYGLVDVLNNHFQAELNITASLAVLAVGCLLFWPSGVKASFGGFCGSMFVVGAGLSTLETAADPFLAICGPPRYSEIRLNLAQAVQGVGSFVAPLLASRVFFAHTVDTKEGLKNVQWVYLGVACFVGLLFILFFLAPFPEITDADMGLQEAEIEGQDVGPLRKQYGLFLAAWSQFWYVGAQVALAAYFINFCKEAGKTPSQSSDLLAVGQGLYAFNRFLAGGLLMIRSIKPRILLMVYLSMAFVFSVAAMNTSGKASIAVGIIVFCFESACFATIFTLGLRGIGRHTKRGGSFLVSAISGGMVVPPMMGAVVTNRNAHVAMAIPMMGYILALAFPLYVNFSPKQREIMDLHRDTEVNLAEEKMIGVGKEVELGAGAGAEGMRKRGEMRVENVA